MELDDFKPAWNLMQQRLDATHTLVIQALTESRLARVRSLLRMHGIFAALELILGILACAVLGYFLFQHVDEVRFAVPGIVLWAGAVLTTIESVRQLDLLGRIDFAGPVLEIQRQIAEFRASRVRIAFLVLIASPLIWVPMAIVGAKGLIGVDLYRTFGAAWIITNLVLGVLVLVGGIWASRRWQSRLADTPVLGRLADGLAGRGLTLVRKQLEELTRFKSEA